MSEIELVVSQAIIVILGAISIILSIYFVRRSDERWEKVVTIVLLVIFSCILIFFALTIFLGFCLQGLDSEGPEGQEGLNSIIVALILLAGVLGICALVSFILKEFIKIWRRRKT